MSSNKQKKTDLLVGKTDMGYMGEDYQYSLVKCFIEDTQFFSRIQSLVNQNMFTVSELRMIVGFMKDRYAKTGRPAIYKEISMHLNRTINDDITRERAQAIVEQIKGMPMEAIDMVEEEATNFFKQQNLIQAINRATEIVRRGNISEYTKIEGLFQEALSVNMRDEIGGCLFDDDAVIEADLSPDFRRTITTGVEEFDIALGGGLGRCELGLLVSPMNVGKTSVTTGFAAAAAVAETRNNNYKGYKVLHVFFEDNEVAIRRKYYGYLLNIDSGILHNENVRPRALELLKDVFNKQRQMLKENIRYVRLKSGEVTASDIGNLIRKHISTGFKPDLVVIDYFECLLNEPNVGRNYSEWSGEAFSMRKLESLANEFDVAMWVPVQSTKDAIGESYVGLKNAGGSVRKTQIGHIVMQLARTEEQKTLGTMNVYIGKIRGVKFTRDKFLNVNFNNGTCRFDLRNATEEFVNNDFNTPSTSSQVAGQVAKGAYRGHK